MTHNPIDLVIERVREVIAQGQTELKVDPHTVVERLALLYGVTEAKPPVDQVDWNSVVRLDSETKGKHVRHP